MVILTIALGQWKTWPRDVRDDDTRWSLEPILDCRVAPAIGARSVGKTSTRAKPVPSSSNVTGERNGQPGTTELGTANENRAVNAFIRQKKGCCCFSLLLKVDMIIYLADDALGAKDSVSHTTIPADVFGYVEAVAWYFPVGPHMFINAPEVIYFSLCGTSEPSNAYFRTEAGVSCTATHATQIPLYFDTRVVATSETTALYPNNAAYRTTATKTITTGDCYNPSAATTDFAGLLAPCTFAADATAIVTFTGNTEVKIKPGVLIPGEDCTVTISTGAFKTFDSLAGNAERSTQITVPQILASCSTGGASQPHHRTASIKLTTPTFASSRRSTCGL